MQLLLFSVINSNKLITIKISLISVSMFGRLEGYESEPKIGDYSQYISGYSLCGIGRKALLPEEKCLKYSADLAPIDDSRVANSGEVPWVVSIQTFGPTDSQGMQYVKIFLSLLLFDCNCKEK